MAKFTSFTMTPQGELAYSNTGRLAPSSYTVRGNTVYGADNRKIGNVKKFDNLKKAQRQKVESASRSRQHRRAQQIKNAGQQKPRRPRKPTQKAREPKVPVSEEYLEEYRGLLADYAQYLRDADARNTLANATVEQCEMLHALAYDVYETFIQYGEQARSGEMSPHQRATFERQGKRLASLLKAIR